MAQNVIVTTPIGLFQMTDGFVLTVKGHVEMSPFKKVILFLQFSILHCWNGHMVPVHVLLRNVGYENVYTH